MMGTLADKGLRYECMSASVANLNAKRQMVKLTTIKKVNNCSRSAIRSLTKSVKFFRSSHQRGSLKKGVLKNFTKFTGKPFLQNTSGRLLLIFPKLAIMKSE